MSKVAGNLVSTIIQKDKVLVKSGVMNQNCKKEIDDVIEQKDKKDIASYWVNQLSLLPHPFMEETYFKETFIDPQYSHTRDHCVQNLFSGCTTLFIPRVLVEAPNLG